MVVAQHRIYIRPICGGNGEWAVTIVMRVFTFVVIGGLADRAARLSHSVLVVPFIVTTTPAMFV